MPQAWSDAPGLGVTDLTTWTFTAQTDLYVFVKLISGNGAFSLDGKTFTCGDGHVEPVEECDDGNTQNGDCCSVACQTEPQPCGVTISFADDGGTEAGGTESRRRRERRGCRLGRPAVHRARHRRRAATRWSTPPAIDVEQARAARRQRCCRPFERYEAGGGGCSTSSPKWAINSAVDSASCSRGSSRDGENEMRSRHILVPCFIVALAVACG